MFDCVMPTRNARNGTLFTHFGKLSIKSPRYKLDENPIDSECDCYTCKHHSRAYLNHLYRSGEFSYFRLASIHNLRYYQRLTQGMRDALDNGTFDEFVTDFYARRGLEVPPCPVD